MGPAPPAEAALNALHVQNYPGGGEWSAAGAPGTTGTPPVLAIGLAEAQMTQVMANIRMPKYIRNPEDLDELERTRNNYVNDSTMDINKAQ